MVAVKWWYDGGAAAGDLCLCCRGWRVLPPFTSLGVTGLGLMAKWSFRGGAPLGSSGSLLIPVIVAAADRRL